MLTEIKEKLIGDSSLIIQLLEEYGFEHISAKVSELRCARNNEGGQNISIRLTDNNVLVKDYARNISSDIIGYIMQEKQVDFKTVLNSIKKILGLSDTWQEQKRIPLFGGWYDKVGIRTNENNLVPVPQEKLAKYDLNVGNFAWVKDGISLETQRVFQVGYDVDSQRIIFPIKNEVGDIVGIKGRINYKSETAPKYLYLERCDASQTLFGYSENYSYMYSGVVCVAEAEKTVMQAATMGYHNIVALGSHSLSEKQTQLILQLSPKKVIIMLDEGLEKEETIKNLKMLKSFSTMRDLELWYWDSTLDIDLFGTKSSPTDNGKEKFKEILETQLIKYEEQE